MSKGCATAVEVVTRGSVRRGSLRRWCLKNKGSVRLSPKHVPTAQLLHSSLRCWKFCKEVSNAPRSLPEWPCVLPTIRLHPATYSHRAAGVHRWTRQRTGSRCFVVDKFSRLKMDTWSGTLPPPWVRRRHAGTSAPRSSSGLTVCMPAFLPALPAGAPIAASMCRCISAEAAAFSSEAAAFARLQPAEGDVRRGRRAHCGSAKMRDRGHGHQGPHHTNSLGVMPSPPLALARVHGKKRPHACPQQNILRSCTRPPTPHTFMPCLAIPAIRCVHRRRCLRCAHCTAGAAQT